MQQISHNMPHRDRLNSTPVLAAITLLLLMQLLWFTPVFSQEAPSSLSKEAAPVQISADIYFDASGTLGIDDIRQMNEKSFQPVTTNNKEFGYTSGHAWLRLTASAKQPTKKFIQFSAASLGEVIFFKPHGRGFDSVQGGTKFSPAQRPYHSRTPTFELDIPSGGARYYIKLDSAYYLDTDFSIIEGEEYHNSINDINVTGFVYSVMCTLAAYIFFITLTSRIAIYLYYLIYVISTILLLATMDGFMDRFLWLSFLGGWSKFTDVFAGITIFSLCLFFTKLLDTKTRCPKLHRITNFSLILVGIGMLAPIDQLRSIVGPVGDIGFLLFLVSTFAVSVLSIRDKKMEAYYFVGSYLFLVAAVLIAQVIRMTTNSLGLLANAIILHSMCAQMLTMAIGIGHSIRHLGQQRFEQESRAQNSLFMLQVLTHDLRNHVAVTKGISQFMLNPSKAGGNDNPNEKWALVLRAAEREIAIIEKAGTILKLDAKVVQCEMRPLKIGTMLGKLLEMHKEAIDTKKIVIESNYVDCTSEVLSDEILLLNQVFANILTNAIKFSYPSGVIEIDIQENSDALKCTFRDHGVGMPKEIVEKVNSIKDTCYLQVESHLGTNDEQGTGFGLLIIKKACHVLGCTMQISSIVEQSHSESSSDHGTQVTLKIPKPHALNKLEIA